MGGESEVGRGRASSGGEPRAGAGTCPPPAPPCLSPASPLPPPAPLAPPAPPARPHLLSGLPPPHRRSRPPLLASTAHSEQQALFRSRPCPPAYSTSTSLGMSSILPFRHTLPPPPPPSRCAPASPPPPWDLQAPPPPPGYLGAPDHLRQDALLVEGWQRDRHGGGTSPHPPRDLQPSPLPSPTWVLQTTSDRMLCSLRDGSAIIRGTSASALV